MKEVENCVNCGNLDYQFKATSVEFPLKCAVGIEISSDELEGDCEQFVTVSSFQFLEKTHRNMKYIFEEIGRRLSRKVERNI